MSSFLLEPLTSLLSLGLFMTYGSQMEPVPHYITADVDVSLKEFCGQGHKLVSRFYFEFISGLPMGHCSDCYVYFRFKKQFPVYLTPRYMGRCECPVLDCAVQVEEEVFGWTDFLRL